MRNKIVALEGPVAAGKSTTLKLLCEKNYPVIAEYMDYASMFPRENRVFPAESVANAKENFEYFLELEHKRYNDYKKIPNKKIVFLDRSIFTLAAFEKGISLVTHIDIYDWSLEKIIEQKENLLWPDTILYFNLDINESKKRILTRNMTTHPIFTNQQFDIGFRDAFEQFEKQGYIKLVDIDASKSTDTIYKQIKNFMQ